MTAADSNKRIAKNTLFLYIRMIIMMLVNLYTARLILQALGVQDFGIYNVVAGIIVLFTFINGSLSVASQRFLNFSLGKGNVNEVGRVFSMSLTAHMVIALLVFLFSETIGLIILRNMNFPIDRYYAVEWTYQYAVLTCLVKIVRVPYNASIIAYEKMSFYAWISIIEAFLNLLIVFVLILFKGDKLIVYSCLLLMLTFIINLIYLIYCKLNFSTCKYRFFWDTKLMKKFLSFMGWSLAGSIANVGAQQGLNMIINIFCGVYVNAAVGISNQVMSAVGNFLSNFQTAFNPQLVKSYASNDEHYFMTLIFKSSKFSYYLMLIISLPVLINCDFFLKVWLGTVPIYAVEFSQLMIVFLLFDAISGPLWISVQATGKIKHYQLLMAFLILLNLPLTYIVLRLGLSPVYVFVGRVSINIITLLARIIYLRKLINLPIYRFIKDVLLVLLIVTVISLPLPIFLDSLVTTNWINVICISFCSIIISSTTIYYIGLTRGEKNFLHELIIKKISNHA